MPTLLTQEEMARACTIAEQEVLKRSEQFKPARATAIRDEKAWSCEQVFMGAAGDELACSIKLQWNYMAGGCVQRICQYVHAQLRILRKEDRRYLRLAGLHLADWSKEPEHKRLCVKCGPAFQAWHEVVADTSLHEY
jgi:hypothetical protein